jgi:two-component system chemotaxis response regulator CheB
MYPSMPRSAISSVNVDYVVPVSGIARLLVEMTASPEREFGTEVPAHLPIEVKIANQEDPLAVGVGRLGEPSVLSCPECHGVLLQLKEGSYIRFRCHTGHAYSAQTLLAQIQEEVEIYLWNTVRAMQEANVLMRAMAEHIKTKHPSVDPSAFVSRAEALHEQTNTLRQMLASHQ